jgi:C-terminal processing protease CtpA/Prc
MLNGCAIDNVLPAMAMHADLLKGDIIVKVDDQPTVTETVHKQLIGEDVPGTSVMLTVRRGHTERTAQLIRMANSDIADMRRVFEIFTNLKSRFPTISGEVDEVVTIWSEVDWAGRPRAQQ